VARFLQENGALRTEAFTATRFVLLSARPGSGGGPYVIEAAYPFDGGDQGAHTGMMEP
jgi:2'-5' RNA ligase